MKKLILSIFFFVSAHAFSQTITLDSLTAIINRLQVQVNTLQKLVDTTAFVPGQATVTNISSTNHLISINNYAAMANSAALAIRDSLAITALKIKIASLKVVIPSTTIPVQ